MHISPGIRVSIRSYPSVAEKMKNREKTTDQLVGELAELRQLVRDVQAMVEEVLGESQDGLQQSFEGMPAGADCQPDAPDDERAPEAALVPEVQGVSLEKNLHGSPTEAERSSAAMQERTSAPLGQSEQRIWLAKRAILLQVKLKHSQKCYLESKKKLFQKLIKNKQFFKNNFLRVQ